MEYENLTLIGTSHIARESINEVKEAITAKKPSIVAVELDANRYYSLNHPKKTKISIKDIFGIGLIGFLFAVLGRWAQKKLGNLVGVMPGSEMLTAIRLAKKRKSHILLIDQDISITLRRLSKSITFREEMRFVLEIFKSVLFPRREMRRLGINEIDLRKVPPKELITKLMADFREKYPNAYRVLVSERNIIMAKRLAEIMDKNKDKKIVAVVGAGHEEEMIELIKRFERQSDGISYSLTVD